jgi:ADP-heptose:LPS heptosyltransferase
MQLLSDGPAAPARRRRPVGQSLEDVARHEMLRVVAGTARLLSGRRDRIPPTPQRVLFICEDAIGDLILTLPTLRAITESRPGTTVDLVTSEYSTELVRHLPYIHRVIVFPRYDNRRLSAAWAMLRRGAYDAVVDGMVMRSHVRTRTIAMMLGARAPVWIGEGGRTNDHVYSITVPPAVPRMLHAERMMQLARPFTDDAARASIRPRLELTASERAVAEAVWASTRGAGDRILINLSASSLLRRWPDASFAALLDRIRSLRPTASIVIVGLPQDGESATMLAGRFEGTASVPTLRELMALVAMSDIVVSPDTAVCHMAAAFERTLVSLALRDHEAWVPASTPGARVIGPSAETFEGLEIRPVVDAVTRVLLSSVPNADEDGVRRHVASV